MTITRSTWDEILVSKDADAHLDSFQTEGHIRAWFPDLEALVGFGGEDTGHKDLWAHTRLVVKQTLPRPVLRWAALFHDVAKPLCFDRDDSGHISFHGHEHRGAGLFKRSARRVGFFTDAEVDEISFIIYHLGHIEAYEPGWTDSAVRRCARTLEPYLDSVFAVARADCTTKHSYKRRKQLARTKELRTRIETLDRLDAIPPALPKGLGKALMDVLGLDPGPELGRIVKTLKSRVEAGELPRNAPIEVYLSHLVSGKEI